MLYYVRLGALAEIHRASGPTGLGRTRRVIVRTPRGTEVAEVVGPAADVRPDGLDGQRNLSSKQDTQDTQDTQKTQNPAESVPGIQILRPTSSTDELLIGRLNRFRRRAVRECQLAMKQTGCPGVLLDIDQLFDGGTLVLHFMGADETTHRATEPVIDKYESIVRSRELARQLTVGCGPGCGTGTSTGCGTQCGSCGIAAACRPKG